MLDGATHNNPYDNLNLPLPFPDALQEFRLETSSTTATNGMHSSASVNAVTKSGTNMFHGDLFEFVRNHRFNATNRFNAVDPVTGEAADDGLSRHQFGGTFGGPLRPTGCSSSARYQGTRLRETPADLFAFVPTAAMWTGDFTQYASAACNTGGAVTLRPPFVGNQVNPARLSPAALKHHRASAYDDRPLRPLQLQPEPSSGRSAIHRKVDAQLTSEPLDVRTVMLTTR